MRAAPGLVFIFTAVAAFLWPATLAALGPGAYREYQKEKALEKEHRRLLAQRHLMRIACDARLRTGRKLRVVVFHSRLHRVALARSTD